MVYLPAFNEDVFISYAHNDDDVYAHETRGWVTQLHEDLARRVRNYLGSDIRLWRDCEIRNNEDFTNKILNRLARTGTFLSVLSPSFLQREWCRRELDIFVDYAKKHIGILIGDEKSRIFKVEKMPVARSQLPDAMQGTKTYRFYEPDPNQPRRLHELRPTLGGDYYRRYFEEMDELAKDIAELLQHMRQEGETPEPPTQGRTVVYVAETTSDLDDKAGEIRRDVKDRGYLVLPSGDLPYRAAEYRKNVRECLSQAALSIHLVGAEYGVVLEGETKSNIWVQHDLAMERGADPKFLRLIWMPGDVQSSDPRQQQFVNYLSNDADVLNGADLLNRNLEELKTIMHEKLERVRNDARSAQRGKEAPPPAADKPAGVEGAQRDPDDPLRVYLICEKSDRKSPSLIALRKYLLAQGCEPMLPAESDDAGQALQNHVDNLAFCDACLIYYGEGSPEWYQSKLSDLRKYLRGRQPPVKAKGIYVQPSTSAHKDEVETLEGIVMRGGEEFSPEAIGPFLQKLRPPSQGS